MWHESLIGIRAERYRIDATRTVSPDKFEFAVSRVVHEALNGADPASNEKQIVRWRIVLFFIDITASCIMSGARFFILMIENN